MSTPDVHMYSTPPDMFAMYSTQPDMFIPDIHMYPPDMYTPDVIMYPPQHTPPETNIHPLQDTMSSQALSLDVSIIRPRLDVNPRIRYQDWHASVFTVARNLSPGLDPYGSLFFVATDEEWQRLRQNLLTPAIAAHPAPRLPRNPRDSRGPCVRYKPSTDTSSTTSASSSSYCIPATHL
jgi:hypothetical protein